MAIVNDVEIERLISLRKTVINPKARNTEQRGSRRKTFDLRARKASAFKCMFARICVFPKHILAGSCSCTLRERK